MYSDIIKRWKDRNPMTAQRLGFHEYDGKLPTYDLYIIELYIEQIIQDLESLRQMAEPDDRFERFEYHLIISRLEVELFYLRDHKEYLISPIPYLGPAGVIETVYASRSFAPLNDRIASIIEIQEGLPVLLDQSKQNLQPPLARAKVSMALNFAQGYLNYFKDKLIEVVSKTDDDSLMERWSDANEKAIKRLEEFRAELKGLLQDAHTDFALGEDKFLEMLEKTEGVKIDIDSLLMVGEEALESDYKDLIQIGIDNNTTIEEITNDMMSDIPDPAILIDKVSESLDRTRDFLIEEDLVTLPSKEQCLVVDMPEAWKKFAFAAMNTPGPFEPKDAKEAYYYINIPPADMSEDQKMQRMAFFNLAQLELVTIHEAWPGHYLQLLVNNQSSSDIAKMFARSVTLIEGWGLYTEKMVIDEGYDKLDLVKLRVAQLKASALRAARFVSAVKMHCKGMTVEESKQLFMEKAFATEAMASIEANRGTINPMYLNYTLGKTMIYKLREDYRKEKAEDFTIKGFHDEILSYASPPITVLRKMMLSNPGGMDAVL